MSTSGLWVQTAHDGWLRADQVVQVACRTNDDNDDKQDGPEVLVAVPTAGQATKLASYLVASCPNAPEAKVVAFNIVRSLATQAHVAGLLRVRQSRVEVTPFGELDPNELFPASRDGRHGG